MRCASLLATHWPIITAAAMALLAYATPAGAAYYKPTITPLIATIFAILGLTLDLTELRSGASACHVHALLQLFSLGLCPALYYGCVYHWGWAERAGILTEPLAVGCMAAAAMPVTAATSLVFVVQARGELGRGGDRGFTGVCLFHAPQKKKSAAQHTRTCTIARTHTHGTSPAILMHAHSHSCH